MKYKVFGKTKIKISEVGLGFWQIGSTSWKGDISKAKEIVKQALDSGINFFDTAEVYGNGKSEMSLGNAIKELNAIDSTFVATKVGGFRPTEYFIEKGIKRSIKNLGFKPHLLQLHWPPPIWIPLCSTIRGLEKMVDKGYVDFIGVSNFSGKLLNEAIHCTSKHEIISNQIEYNLAYRVPEIDIFPLAKKENVEIIAYSPLAKGALAGALNPNSLAQKSDKKFNIIKNDNELISTLNSISQKRGYTWSQISLKWLINNNTLPIPGTRNKNRVIEYANSSEIELDKEELSLLNSVTNKYVNMWGNKYGNLNSIRYVPCILQYIGIKIAGGA
ncbi:putative oxidoreductase, aryl-alcohol dehydrogenase like protein [Caldisphaera lagunensis DSM 15908]|uniref:Putative oxidoreductase, aryl-alcohol dehydrogenase like protein n=1 Tax=Caldisphaera lagunensis (strain DSM 15908 / JCM 11604 / ANMR 0165 / IC-154) TaxID=1056495 RepID=L0AB29_CALLD|nr:aldo/keto reductase [Caldisphaera lagunensis]AFZ70347.1 putative oxidoreductase, aryl-alcohol dehydrogenase like protein [Caldisphaera lagunensis DSM 15908]